MNKYHKLVVSFQDAKYAARKAKFHPVLDEIYFHAKEMANINNEKYSDAWYAAIYEGMGIIVTSNSCEKRVKNWFARHGFTF